jgi:hypothetical protein
MSEENTTPQVTYATEEHKYDVSKLSDEGKTLFGLIAECANESNMLNKRRTVLQGAIEHFKLQMAYHLTEEAIISEVEEEES